jgi:RNA polymerase sigma factor (sigma-70 family)
MADTLLRTDKEIAEIYARHVDTVYRVCFAYLKNPADTEDMVQSTFLKLIEYKGQFNDEEHEKAWLIVTSTNMCKNLLKHWWRKRADIDECCGLYSGDQSPAIDETLEAVLVLPEKYKTAVYLYYYEGYTSQEIAGMLHRPPSTIRNHLSEARKILRNKLGGEFNEE